MAAPLDEKVRPEEVVAFLHEVARLMTIGTAATLEERLALQETKVNLLRRIACHPSPLLCVSEPLNCALLAEEEANRLRKLLAAEGEADV